MATTIPVGDYRQRLQVRLPGGGRSAISIAGSLRTDGVLSVIAHIDGQAEGWCSAAYTAFVNLAAHRDAAACRGAPGGVSKEQTQCCAPQMRRELARLPRILKVIRASARVWRAAVNASSG